MQQQAFRVGLIGAGNISEFHMRALSRVRDARVVAVVDSDLARAEALCRKWQTGRPLTEVSEMFEAGVDVVHVLTPPASHAQLTLAALQHNCHVYVEKPMATAVEDCDRILELASKQQRSVCVGHSFLRDPMLVRCRQIVDSGAIGEPLSIDYVRSTEYPKYRGGPLPEMYRDGGYPFRDMGVHGLYLIESYLGRIEDAHPVFSATGADPSLHFDEWTVALRTARGQATVSLSWNSRPQQHVLTIYGTRGIVRADMYAMYVSVKRARRVPGHVLRVLNSLAEARQMAFGTLTGLAGFALGKVRQYHGLQSLVEEFYQTLQQRQESPVTPLQARSVVSWTERIAATADAAKIQELSQACQQPQAATLVTGGTGLIGQALVRRLLANGRRLRLLVRRLPADSFLRDHPQVELLVGDLGDPAAVDRAVAGTDTVFHLGAAMRGTTEEFNRGTIVGTGNVVDAAVRHRVSQFVYVSSLSVLHALAPDTGAPITENWPLEPHAELRGNYSRTKLAAEQIVRDAVQQRGLRAVILRPGEVLGDGSPRVTAGLALQFGRRLVVLGNGESVVPLVYVGDLVDALLAAEKSQIGDGTVLHLVDTTPLTQNDMLRRVQQTADRELKVSHLPRFVVRLAGWTGDLLGRLTRRQLPITSYRLGSACAARRYNCQQAEQVLGWTPRVGTVAALAGQAVSAGHEALAHQAAIGPAAEDPERLLCAK